MPYAHNYVSWICRLQVRDRNNDTPGQAIKLFQLVYCTRKGL